MDALFLLLSLGCGIGLAFAWFGADALLSHAVQTCGLGGLDLFTPAVAAAVPAVVLLLLGGWRRVAWAGLLDGSNWLAAAAAVCAAVWIVTWRAQPVKRSVRELLLSGCAGALMELPQRLMMQSFVWSLLEFWGVGGAMWYAIPVTGLVWCVGLVVQYPVTKTPFPRGIGRELLASFVFSCGAGVAFARTGLPLLPMAAHFCERFLGGLLRAGEAGPAR